MTQERWLDLPKDVAIKIEKVLGIAASDLEDYDLVKLIDELCDTALMFDNEEHDAGDSTQQKPSDEAAAESPS